ncbi:Metalloendoproteinase 5-mmp [Thalictrum thalictroides]|uniref:Metalloendoproteinase 5-mmp n=1 Tax=Thalictrum thalictroides TaxID=46969 RepID=A0A7J6WDR6_THATH|nr:Metalloendoproteinase 5-mmp [Thalictrum thalictroides]
MVLKVSLLLFVMLLPSVFCIPSEQPFEFLQHLEGCHKGMTMKGVHQLKRYLGRFGYLRNNEIATLANDNEFDDVLESAVKTYQLNYGLNMSGSLDSQTVKEMMKPRCGVADIIDGQTRMASGKSKHQHGPLYTFFEGNQKWPASQTALTWKVISKLEVVDIQVLRPILSRAFAKWAAVTHFTFSEADDTRNPEIMIGFYRLNHGDSTNFDGPGGILAHTYAPPAGVSHYDADEKWGTTDTKMDEFDLESVVLHEIGHALGLQHTAVPGAVMVSTIGPGVIKRDLQPDDIEGIRTLYNIT